MPKQFTDSVKQTKFTDWCIAAFTLALVIVSAYQGYMLRQQVETMQKSVRPFVATSPIINNNWKLPTEHDIEITMHSVNTTAYPATNVVYSLPEILLEPDALEKSKRCDLDYVSAVTTLYPHEDKAMPTVSSRAIDDVGKERIMSLKDRLVIYGGIKYSGFSDEQFETKFCWTYNPQPNAMPWSTCSCESAK